MSNAYQGVQGGLAEQQKLLQALQAQNGIQNQSDVYGQFQDVAAGKGPNPAQAMLNQSTGQNVANQAALMAGQRGASANVGLMARQAAQQGANTQQQAAGQAATMQAQQSLNALGQAGGLASQQAANQVGQTNANTAAQQSEQQNLLNAQQAYNNNIVGMQSNINSANAGLANTQLQGQHGIIGGVLNGVGGALGLAEGGEASRPFQMGDGGPQSSLGKHLFTMGAGDPLQQGMGSFVGGIGRLLKSAPNQGTGVAAPTNQPMTQTNYMMPASAAKGGVIHDYRGGGKVNAKVPAEKANKTGNSYSNDKIPAVLSEHEIVLPRSVTMSSDPISASAKFVSAVISKRRAKR